MLGMPQRKCPAQELGKWDWPEKMANDRKKGEDSGVVELGSKSAFKIKSCNF